MIDSTVSETDFFRSNPLLKRANAEIEWTDEMVLEYVKCKNDIAYFIRTYIKIINLDEGLVNFEMWDFQEKIATTIADNRFTIIKTPRQAGKTTTSAAVILWHVLFNDDYTAAILANKLATSIEILSRVQRAFENLPSWLQVGVLEWNKGSVKLENGSKILASATASTAIRGYSINFLYLDEFAFIQRGLQDEFFTSVYPTIVSGKKTKVVITSTPNGFDLFYKIWTDASEGRNDYVAVPVFWSDIPGRDEEWKKKTIANTSESQFRQEFEAEFIGSSNTLISPDVLRRLAFNEPMMMQFDNSLRIFEEPEEGHTYFCTVDTSRGVGIDNSAFIIYDLTEYPFKVVAAYSNNLIDPLLYPDIIYQVVKWYNEAFTLIEINDNGQQIADILHNDLEYEYIVFTASRGRAGQVIGGGYSASSQKGVRTTKAVKRIGCANIRSMIENDQLLLRDFHLIREFSTFIVNKDSYEAEEGSHDDLVMCCVLLAWATEQEFFKDITNTNFRQRLLEQKAEQIYDSSTPFGFISDDVAYYVEQQESEDLMKRYGIQQTNFATW